MTTRQTLITLAASAAACGPLYAQLAPTWIKKVGTQHEDLVAAVAAAPDGGVVSAQRSYVDVPMQAPLHWIVTRKHDAGGDLLWSREFTSGQNDRVNEVSLDDNGNIFLVGTTEGGLAGPPLGGPDAFLITLDSGGDLRWSKQFGTTGLDDGDGVAAGPAGSAYVVGNVGLAAFTAKYDANGNEIWSRELGSASLPARGLRVAVDEAGDIVVGGDTEGDLFATNGGGRDPFIVKYTPEGTVEWARQFELGSPNEPVTDIGVDSFGNIYATLKVTRETHLVKFSPSGDLRWSVLVGQEFPALTLDESGGIFLGGSLHPGGGLRQAFILEYDDLGNRLSESPLDPRESSAGSTIVYGGAGIFYLGGIALDPVPLGGLYDGFVARFEPEEPPCYPDCNGGPGAGVLDIFDFLCFQDAFIAGDPYADCDQNTILNILDFLCFQDAFTQGCP